MFKFVVPMSDKKVLINPTSICVFFSICKGVCLSLRGGMVLTLTVQIPQGRIVKTVNVALQQTAGGRKLQAVVSSSGQTTLASAISDAIRPARTISSIPDSSGHVSRCSVGQRTDRGQGRGQRHGGGGGVFVWRAVQLTDTVVTKISSTANDDGMATKNRPVIVVVEVGFKITRA